MDRQKVDPRAKAIEIPAKSKREFFLLHGYTGSPTDFNKLGEYLSKRFNANVKIIRLLGHGEKIENIDNLNYNDFLVQAEKELKKDIKRGREIIVGGISVGSFIALQLSAKYPVKGVLNISIPYKNKLLTEIISFFEPIILKKHWVKPIPEYEKELRKSAFYYGLNLRGLKIIRQAKEELRKSLCNISVSCLMIHVRKDHIFHPKGAKAVIEGISSKVKELSLLETNSRASHNPFYTSQHGELYKIIGDFVEKNSLFDKEKIKKKEKK